MTKMITIILASVMLFSSCDTAEKEIHLIPSGYEGAVTIIFDCKDGGKLEYEEGARVYRIGKDGILKLNASFNKGLLKPDEQLFFYVDSAGNRSAIKHHIETQKSAITNDLMIFNLQFHGNCFVNGKEFNSSAVQYLVSTEEKRERFFKERINPCDLYCN